MSLFLKFSEGAGSMPLEPTRLGHLLFYKFSPHVHTTLKSRAMPLVRSAHSPLIPPCGFLINTVQSLQSWYKSCCNVWYAFSAAHSMLLPGQKPSSSYRKIPKISPGAYIFQRPFLRGLFLEGLILGGAYLGREICVSKSIGLAL